MDTGSVPNEYGFGDYVCSTRPLGPSCQARVTHGAIAGFAEEVQRTSFSFPPTFRLRLVGI